MGAFTKIPTSTFNELAVEAGVLLKTFDPATPTLEDKNIICATTGGITVTCASTTSDWGSDVDNCPNNTKELKRIDGWDCSLAFTALNVSAETIRLALGAADINAESGAIIPRRDLKDTDFANIWWVGDRSDGGLVAIELKNALSTSGFSLKTAKNGKGQISVTLTGHVSISEQDVVPMSMYVKPKTA